MFSITSHVFDILNITWFGMCNIPLSAQKSPQIWNMYYDACIFITLNIFLKKIAYAYSVSITMKSMKYVPGEKFTEY